MPKKFTGENSKAVVARARKDGIRKEQLSLKKQKEEDEYWKDDDKQILRKQMKKEEKYKKKEELLQRKQLAKELLNTEMDSIKTVKKDESKKITRTQIMTQLQSGLKSKNQESPIVVEPLVENINRLVIDGEEARTVDEAISVLSTKEKVVDKHPEKRLKAAYAAFQEENLEKLKKEYPTLRLSQIKQLLRKEWMKSPANPMNKL